jgi:hypothetical protein
MFWEKPKLHSTESHAGMTKFYKGESVGTFETNQNERISTDGRPRQESARLPTDTTKFRFKAQSRHRSHQRIHQRHHYRRTYLSNGSAHDVLAKWKTKKYHDLTSRIAEKGFTVRFFAFEVGCRGLVPHCIGTSEEDQ